MQFAETRGKLTRPRRIAWQRTCARPKYPGPVTQEEGVAMQLPVQITFRNMEPSDAVQARIQEWASKLERYHGHIIGCRVMIEAPHRHHHQGKLFHVRIDLTVPDGEVVVKREPADHHAHEDVYVAIRDAFKAAQRRLEDHVRRQRGDVKTHEPPPETS